MTTFDHLWNLRLLVATLGEKQHFGRWPSSFLTPTGLSYQTMNFPRTAAASCLQASCVAAKRIHDDVLPQQGHFHLFRLPAVWEHRLAEISKSQADRIVQVIQAPREVLVEELRLMTKDKTPVARGPILSGEIGNLETSSGLAKCAGYYLFGMLEDVLATPYFQEVQE